MVDGEKVERKLEALEEAILIPLVIAAFHAVDWWEDKPWYIRGRIRNTAIVLAVIAVAVTAVNMQ